MPGLAYIGKIIDITPIIGADRVELATVVCGKGGKWNGVVAKGMLTGDLVEVYLQDAIVPQEERFAFMEKRNWRVSMARFRGAPSECLIMPCIVDGEVGQDITQLVSVTKYEKPIPAQLAGEMEGTFPSFIPKTDEPNFQAARHLVKALTGQPWVATQKLDGTSCTVFRYGAQFGVCSRNWQLREGPNVYWQVAQKYDLAQRLPAGYALQMEVVGPGIQGNPLGLREVGAYPFNVYDIAEQCYLSHDDTSSWTKYLGITQVPTLYKGESFNFTDEELRGLAEGNYPNGKAQEGIVIRPQCREMRVGNDRLSFKVLNLGYKG